MPQPARSPYGTTLFVCEQGIDCLGVHQLGILWLRHDQFNQWGWESRESSVMINDKCTHYSLKVTQGTKASSSAIIADGCDNNQA